MNYTQIAGHLGADPEERRTPTGKKVTTLRVATNVWNEGKEETLWWTVSVWGDEFDNLLKHMKKGSAVFILGTMRKPRIWNDREGKPQVALEINAKIVSFSPYGKGDRPAEGENQGRFAAPGAPSSNYGNMGGDADFGMASFSAPGSSGHRYESSGNHDEEMPF